MSELLDVAHSLGIGVSGASRSQAVIAISLFHVYHRIANGDSVDAAIKQVAEIQHCSHCTIRAEYREFENSKTIRSVDNSKRGKGSPRHPLSPHSVEYPLGPTLEAELLIHDLLQQTIAGGATVVAQNIVVELESRLNLKVCRSTVSRWIEELGYAGATP